MISQDLLIWLAQPEQHRDLIIEEFRRNILPEAIHRTNAQFSPRRLSKQSRQAEPLPTEQRQLSSYRTRLGTMLEYGLSTEVERLLGEAFGDGLYLTFAVAHEFPDFYLRDTARRPLLKIEMKAVDADSDEQAARFDVLTEDLNEHGDFILFVGWKWAQEADWEAPQIFSFAFVPAFEIALVRDQRLLGIGGKIEGRTVLVPSTKSPGVFVKDPGNFGKLWRIIPRLQRKNSEGLAAHVLEFLRFLNDVDDHAPRKRFR